MFGECIVYLVLIWVVSVFTTGYIAHGKRLSIISYVIASLLTGPLGLLLVALASPAPESPPDSLSYGGAIINNLEDARRELLFLKHHASTLQKRILHLEDRITQMVTEKPIPGKVPSAETPIQREKPIPSQDAPLKEEAVPVPDALMPEEKPIPSQDTHLNEEGVPVPDALQEEKTIPYQNPSLNEEATYRAESPIPEERVAPVMESPGELFPPMPVLPPTPEGDAQLTAPQEESFEAVFGKYWLNRIGIFVFFLGMVFFIGYQFAYFSPGVRILMGYGVALGLFLLGQYLEKNEMYVKVARGIQGGSWGILYLSTYAMYYIPATKLIDNPHLELFLLALVSTVTIMYNLKYKSWVVTSITFLLAYITAGLGGIENSTVIYCAFLSAGIVYISYKLQWYKFLTVAVTGSYLTILWFVALPYNAQQTLTRLQINMLILAINWLAFTVALLITGIEEEEKKKYVAGTVLINSLFFSFLGFVELSRAEVLLQNIFTCNPKMIFFLILSALYFLSSYIYKVNKKEVLIPVNLCIAFSLLSLGAVAGFNKLLVTFFLLLETLVIFFIGAYYKEPIYRKFSWLVGILALFRLVAVDYYITDSYNILNIMIKHSLLVFMWGAVCFYGIGILIKKYKIHTVFATEGAILGCGGFALLSISFFSGLPADSISFMLMIEITVIFFLSLHQKETLFRKFLWIMAVVLFIRMLTVDYNSNSIFWGLKHSLTVFFFAGILFYIMANILKKREPEEKITPNESGIYACVGFTLAGVGIISGCPSSLVTLYLIGEMMLIFTLGLLYRELIYRKYTWFMSAFIFFRLMAFDYGNEEFYYFLNFAVKHNVLLLVVSSLVFYLGGTVMKIFPLLESRLEPGEGEVYTYSGIYPAILIGFLLFRQVPPPVADRQLGFGRDCFSSTGIFVQPQTRPNLIPGDSLPGPSAVDLQRHRRTGNHL